MLDQSGSTSFWATFWQAVAALAAVGLLIWNVYDGKQQPDNTIISGGQDPITAKREISRIPSTAETP
ncbi:MAG: hypothetical protein D3905_17020 [Candidatus Electrothrix sp. AS4_5]|nr:hypothetical protein [Candidatus Electrothrix gigas]MCI5191444.1 hypothetical protein [Candidatus Electrothrix gigas]